MPSANDLPRTGQTSASHDVEAQIKQLREDIAALTRSVAALGNEKAGEVRGTARRAAADASSPMGVAPPHPAAMQSIGAPGPGASLPFG